MRWGLTLLARALLLLGFVSSVFADEKPPIEEKMSRSWDQVANIKDAAQRIAKLQQSKGADAAMRFIDACYRTHALASTYSAALESCIVQDYLETKFLTRIYAGLPTEVLSKIRAPSSEQLGQAMGQRIVAAFNQYKVPVKEAEDLKGQVDIHGASVFLKIVLPQAGDDIDKIQSLMMSGEEGKEKKKDK
ncbi:MAG: hypothetical protein ACKOW3_07400 [Hyphomicrobium sp.]